MPDRVKVKSRLAALAGALLALAACRGEPDNRAAENKASPSPVRAAAWDWSAAGEGYGGDPQYAASQALCRRLIDREPPAADRPDERTAASLAGCDAEALYYGIGVRRDPARARLCAFTQRPSAPALEPFAGRAMLMTIYANGAGAVRDLDVAIHLACGLEGAAASELHGRVMRLARLRDARWQGGDFDYCANAGSGLSEGLCASHRLALASPAREGRLRAMLARWTPEERRAFEALRQAHEAFVAASAEGDLARSGTSWRSLKARLEGGLRDQFAGMLERLQAGNAPRFTEGQLRTEDLHLNQAYQARLADERQYDAPGITPERIQDAQRAWLRYRDAFLAFAAVKYPRVPRTTLAAWITQDRSEVIPGL